MSPGLAGRVLITRSTWEAHATNVCVSPLPLHSLEITFLKGWSSHRYGFLSDYALLQDVTAARFYTTPVANDTAFKIFIYLFIF